MIKRSEKTINKNTAKTAKRLLKYVTDTYKLQFILVFVCIFISAAASVSVSLSLKFMLDDFILPLVGQSNPDFTNFYHAMIVLGCIFAAGVIATFIYTRMMVFIGQGVLKRVRDDMFEHMQTLPIRYFDQNTNGSIMSLYTNDTDTLRQMISQAIPQALMSFFTIIVTFIKSDFNDSCSCCYRNHDHGDKSDWWKQRKILYPPAKIISRCDRIYRRENEWTESCQSL